jgi:dTDP-glucose 4,6-dehydratase
MTTYLVTGGAGFIGSNFVKYLLKIHGDSVRIVIFDALTYAGNIMTISADIERENVDFVRGDIRDVEAVAEVMAKYNPDFIVNFAAESHVDRSISGPRLFMDTNILGTQTLLEAARKAWSNGKNEDGTTKYLPGKRFLQIGTDEVYGSLTKDYDSAVAPTLSAEVANVVAGRSALKTFGNSFFTERTPLSPRSPYSASKAGADMIALAYYHTYGFPVVLTRCSNNYGPYQFPEKLIPLIINNLLHGRELPVYGRGANVRDWLYVEDHAKAIEIVLRGGHVGEVYNVGGFNEESNIDIVRLIIAIVAKLVRNNEHYQSLLKCDISCIDERLIRYVTDRPGHDMRYAIDPSKIASELGWYPETPFAVGIERTVRWYLDNPQWIESVTSGDYLQYYDKMYSNR